MSSLLVILLSAVLVCHYAPAISGLRPFEESEPFDNAIGIAAASLATMALASPLGYAVEHVLLARYGLEFLRTFVFVILIMIVAQLVGLAMQRHGRWHPIRNSFVLLITAHCAVLGIALLSTSRATSLANALFWGCSAGLAFGAMLLTFTTLHQRLRHANVPAVFRDAPLALVTIGLMALAFMGFTGIMRD